MLEPIIRSTFLEPVHRWHSSLHLDRKEFDLLSRTKFPFLSKEIACGSKGSTHFMIYRSTASKGARLFRHPSLGRRVKLTLQTSWEFFGISPSCWLAGASAGEILK